MKKDTEVKRIGNMCGSYTWRRETRRVRWKRRSRSCWKRKVRQQSKRCVPVGSGQRWHVSRVGATSSGLDSL